MLLNLVNSFHNTFRFIYKIESDSQFTFLDIMVIKNGALIYDLYKKPTFSGIYFNFHFAHSIYTKIGIVKRLASKVFDLSDEILHNKNLNRIKENLLLNSYPERCIYRYIHK